MNNHGILLIFFIVLFVELYKSPSRYRDGDSFIFK